MTPNRFLQTRANIPAKVPYGICRPGLSAAIRNLTGEQWRLRLRMRMRMLQGEQGTGA